MISYNLSKTPTGLRVLTSTIPTLESVTLTVWAKTGSRMEEKKINGISHFLEHMVFKGTKKRPSARLISQAVDAIGGEFNAATSKDWTNFYIKARRDNLDIAFDVISDMVLAPLLKEEEIEREKGVIVEEIAMYEDTPLMKVGDVFEELIFDGNPLSWDVAGSPKTVKGLKKDDFVRYRDKHYYTDNMLLTVSGGVSQKEVLALAKKYFGEVKSRQSKVETKTFKAKQTKPQVKLHSKRQEQAHFILGFLADARNYKGKFAQAVLATILGGGMSSRLFIEVRERRGLAYSVKTGIERYSDTGYMDTYAGVDPKKIDEAVKVMLEEHYKISNLKPHRGAGYSISKQELKKAKEYIKGHLALELEDTKNVNHFFGEQELFLNKILTPEEVYDKIDEVTIEDVVTEGKRLFVPGRLNLAIIGPYKDSERFGKLLRI